MAKVSSVQKNDRRKKMVKSQLNRRSALKTIIMDKNASAEDRFQATLKLAQMPRNGAKIRIRNRCAITGRPRAFYRQFNMSRIALRDFASQGMIPGVTKSSW